MAKTGGKLSLEARCAMGRRKQMERDGRLFGGKASWQRYQEPPPVKTVPKFDPSEYRQAEDNFR